MPKTYCVRTFVTAEDEETLEILTACILHVLNSPREPDYLEEGVEGMTFEGMLIEEMDSEGKVTSLVTEEQLHERVMMKFRQQTGGYDA